MMKRFFLIIILGVLFIGLFCFYGEAAAVSFSELITNSKLYEGKDIEYQGEVIGAVLKREHHAWLNVADHDKVISVWVPIEQVRKIQFAGNYKYDGDRVIIRGIFHSACTFHGGLFDIHAQEVIVFQQGFLRGEHIEKRKIVALKVLLGVFLLLWIVHRLRKKLKLKSVPA